MQTVALLCTSESNNCQNGQRSKLLFDLKLRNSLNLLKHEAAVTLAFDLKPKYERCGVLGQLLARMQTNISCATALCKYLRAKSKETQLTLSI